MIDHVGFKVSDLARSVAFYKAALAPLGYSALHEDTYEGVSFVGFGAGHKPDFWISEGTPSPGLHVAIHCDSHDAIRAFHAAALAAGGTDNGAPGPRPYHEHYFGAFVLDPDGHNIEAVCHAPT